MWILLVSRYKYVCLFFFSNLTLEFSEESVFSLRHIVGIGAGMVNGERSLTLSFLP